MSVFIFKRPEGGSFPLASEELRGVKVEASEGFCFVNFEFTVLLSTETLESCFPKLDCGRARTVADVPFVGDEDLGLGIVLVKPPLEAFILAAVDREVRVVALRSALPWFCGIDGTGGTLGCLEGDGGRQVCPVFFRVTLIDEAGRDGARIGLSALKKPDLRLPGDGDGVIRESVSIVRSDRDGRVRRFVAGAEFDVNSSPSLPTAVVVPPEVLGLSIRTSLFSEPLRSSESPEDEASWT